MAKLERQILDVHISTGATSRAEGISWSDALSYTAVKPDNLVIRPDLTETEAIKYLIQEAEKKLQSISPETERSLGEISRRELRSQLGASPTKDEALVAKLQQMVDTLSSHVEYQGSPIKVEILESKEIFGVMHPGGTITLSTELIERISNDQALYGILAHEIVHHMNRDSMRVSAANDAFIQLTRSPAFKGLSQEDQIALAKTIRSAVDAINKDIEAEADRRAVLILKRNGIDPKPFAQAILDLGASLKQDSSYLSPQERAELILHEAR